MRDYRKYVYALVPVAAVNLVAMLGMISSLPALVPVHFNIRFEVDGMGTPWMLMIFPAITMAFAISVAIEQKIRGGAYANNKPLTIFSCCFVALFIALGWVLYAMCSTGAQMGDVVSMPVDLVLGLGFSALFIVLGNYLPTIKQNRTFGIRVRATLEDAECWRRTHRFGGVAYVIGGAFAAIVVLAGYFLNLKWLEFAGLLTGVLGSNAVILVYAVRQGKKIKEGSK